MQTASPVLHCHCNEQGAVDKDKEKKKKESILDLAKYLDKQIRVKFSGGREGRPELVDDEWMDTVSLFLYLDQSCFVEEVG